MKYLSKRKPVIISVIAFLLVVLIINISSEVFAKNLENFNSPISYIVSYPISYVGCDPYTINDTVKVIDNDYQIEMEVSRTTHSEINNVNDVVKEVKIYSNLGCNGAIESAIRVLPFKTNPNDSALYDLESYIVKYLGAGIKYYQNTYDKDNIQVAQIVLNMVSNGHSNYYSIYTAFKKIDRTIIFTTGFYTDMNQKDPFDRTNGRAIQNYLQITETFRFIDNKVSNNRFNELDRENLNDLIVNLYIEGNSKFITTF